MNNSNGLWDSRAIKQAMIGFLLSAAEKAASMRDKEYITEELDRLQNQGRLGKSKSTHLKTTGVVRRVDELGRIVVPKELRDVYGIDHGAAVEVYLDPVHKYLVIQRAVQQCVFCGDSRDITVFKNKNVCEACVVDFAHDVVGVEE
ncbi:AbrB/MazE/SpoVT family DNA-binding domain-containing protein [Paenibacillus xylanexedens]|uniref:AbrB/MazE/SpoVT family DNA-binding domain-containing protein n=1 Tax=Paenibacillus xylanexedens TaxID=528191 RepID=UPI001C931804|nr:AbrB/MazE/SpoVT family DNA-binding domain-containing protein [Paenibacillus xylanexedens]